MSGESGSITGIFERGDAGAIDEIRESPKRKRSLREVLGLHEDRVGPIPGGLAAWLGSALFWFGLVYLLFGILKVCE